MGPWLILLEGLLFIALFGGLQFLRREGFSLRFAAESLVFTLVVLAVYWLTGMLLNAFVFLVLLYVITMRARILVDLANSLARRERFGAAHSLYGWAERAGTDAPGKQAARINLGACLVKEKRTKEAIDVLRAVLNENGKLAPKLEVACRYNLGLAFIRDGRPGEGVPLLNDVLELMPTSVYAIGARSELKRYRNAMAPEPAEGDSDAHA
jgi:hypothetical protein